MSIIQAVLLGIVQGLTEFLPISSSAHLVLVPAVLGWDIPAEFNFIFDVIIQMGTLAAVIIYFWPDLVVIFSAMIRGIISKAPFEDLQARLGWLVILATIPAGIIGLVIRPLVKAAFSSPTVTALMFLVTAAFLFLSERLGKQNRKLATLNWVDALLIGLAQSVATFPGISRSGATIGAGILRGIKSEDAARFSFLMSIPIMLASGFLEIKDFIGLPDMSTYLPILIAGTLSAGVTGFFAIRWLLGYLRKHSLYVFSIYCLVAAVITLIILYA